MIDLLNQLKFYRGFLKDISLDQYWLIWWKGEAVKCDRKGDMIIMFQIPKEFQNEIVQDIEKLVQEYDRKRSTEGVSTVQ